MRNVLTVGLCGSMMVLMAVSFRRSSLSRIGGRRRYAGEHPGRVQAGVGAKGRRDRGGFLPDQRRQDRLLPRQDDQADGGGEGGPGRRVVDARGIAEAGRGVVEEPKFAGERPPTLEEVLALVPAGKAFFIEIKCGPEIVPALEKALAKSPVPAENLRIISFNADVIAQCRERLPKVRAHWLTDYKLDKQTSELRPTHETLLKTLRQTRASGLGSKANFEVVTPAFVSQLKGMGLEVGAWTVDKPEDAKRLMGMGVTAITTNRPEFIRRHIEQ